MVETVTKVEDTQERDGIGERSDREASQQPNEHGWLPEK